jgi:hypothetical protein
MKSFLKINLYSIYNICLLVLLFVYPIDNTTEVNKDSNNFEVGNRLEVNDRRIENGKDIILNNKTEFVAIPFLKIENLYQAKSALFIRK